MNSQCTSTTRPAARPFSGVAVGSRFPECLARGWRPGLAAALAALLLGTAAAHAATPLPMLLSSPPAADTRRQAAAAPAAGAAVARQRAIAVNLDLLDSPVGTAPAQLGVELFNGQIVTLERGRIERRGPGNYTWHGHVQGYERGDAVLTVVNGQIAGTIELVDNAIRSTETYELHTGADGAQSLRRLDPGAFPPDHPPGHELMNASRPHEHERAAQASTPSTAADSGSTIDVMIVYSNQTAAAAGSAIDAQVQQAVDRANLAYSNSGIATRLQLVHYQQVAYDESNNFSTDLNRLTNGSDGYMDEVPALRNTYGADLVSLFVENGQYCGIGWVGSSASYAFTVVNRGCAGGNLSLAHELGHNMGALHDPYVDSSTSPFAYGHGYTYPTGGWRTVMAYNDACAAAGTYCTRIAYFSTPLLSYGSPATPLGTAAVSDNARVINGAAYAVANFRAAVTSTTATACSYTLTPTSATATAAGGNASFSVSAGSGCAWNALSSAAWLTISAGSGTSASGTLQYSVAPNAGPARSGTLAVGDQTFTVNQATGCTYALSPGSASLGASAATGNVALTTNATCTWSAGSSAAWLTVTSATTGTGGTTVGYAATANTGAQRSANLSLGGVTFVVTQAAAPTPASLSLSATSISFGNQKVGTTSGAKSVTLKNSGGGTLTVTALTSGGANSAEFIRAGTCAAGTALAVGQSCTLQYTFKPAVKGSRTASLAIATDGGDANLGLSGTGR